MERQTLVFVTERETKNTVRFQEEASGKPPVIGTLYVQRWALGEPLPRRLTVTIEAASAYVTPGTTAGLQKRRIVRHRRFASHCALAVEKFPPRESHRPSVQSLVVNRH